MDCKNNPVNNIDVQHLYNLSYITRYSNVARIKNENVAEHSFFVAVEVMELYQQYDFDLANALSMAITHDWIEADTDDVNHLIKQKYPQLKAELKKAENAEMLKYPNYIVKSFKEYDHQLTFESFIVHIADARQCSRYALNEIQRGNKPYMRIVLDNSKARVSQLVDMIVKDYPNKIRPQQLP
jgi:5'-deoxynucleotidase YfbR-like HD superfamily hydrolase